MEEDSNYKHIYLGSNITLDSGIIINENNKNINDTSTRNLYKKSYKYLCDYVNETQLFYNLVVKPNMIKINNYFYKETLNEGISSFFKVYNTSSYDAKNKCILVEYNSYLKIDNLYGIEFINKYLEYINYENIFLNNFDYKKIDNLLTNIYGNFDIIDIISDIDLTYNGLNKLCFSFNILELMVIKKYDKNEVIEKLNNYLVTRNKTVLKYINNNNKYITLR